MQILLYWFLIATANLLHSIIFFFIILLFVRALLSWARPDPTSGFVMFVNGATDPLLNRVRRYIPPLGFLDMSLFVLMLALYFLDTFLSGSLSSFAMKIGGGM
jgi:YggT family protein